MKDNERFLKRWEEERKKGKFKYILIRTIRYFIMLLLGTAVIAFLVVIFVSMYTGTNALDILNIQVLKKTLLNFSAVLVGFTISFYLEWNNNEKKYNTLLNNKYKR